MITSNMFDIIFLVAIVLIGAVTIGLILARLYQRASKDRAFVRTGLGGQKVVMDGGAVCLPVFHELIWVNMNTLKLEVHRSGADSLFTKDRMRVDVIVAFFVRCIPTVEGIANAAQTLGPRTLDPEALKELVEDKFVDSLRAASVSMTMQELRDKRQDFIQGVQNAVAEDLMKNGLELESVSLTRFDQTQKQFFNADNAFDAEGLTGLTEATQRRAKERNEIEQNTQVAIAQKNFEATQLKLDIEKNQRFATLVQQQEIALREAEQQAQVVSTQAQRKREAEQARIDAERLVKEAEVLRDQAVRQKQIDSDRTISGCDDRTAAHDRNRRPGKGDPRRPQIGRAVAGRGPRQRSPCRERQGRAAGDHCSRGRRGAAQKGGRAGRGSARGAEAGDRDYRRRRSGKGRGAEPRPSPSPPGPLPICATTRPRPRARSGSTKRATRFRPP